MNTTNEPIRLRPPMSRGGRPTKLTNPETRAKFIELLALGLSFKRACAALRFSFPCFAAYREKHPEFQDEIDAAIAKSIERSLRRIERAAERGDTACDRWMLERRFSGEYGRNRIEVTGADGSPLVAAVQIFLPQKDPIPGSPPAVAVIESPKELPDGE